MTEERKPSEAPREPWLLHALIAIGGAVLIYGALALLGVGGRQGAVLIILWAVPVSGVMAACVFFARKQSKVGLWRTFLLVEATALLLAGALSTFALR